MEFQKEMDINWLHELPYLSTSHMLFCFESLLPEITLLVLVEWLRSFSQEVGFKRNVRIFRPDAVIYLWTTSDPQHSDLKQPQLFICSWFCHLGSVWRGHLISVPRDIGWDWGLPSQGGAPTWPASGPGWRMGAQWGPSVRASVLLHVASVGLHGSLVPWGSIQDHAHQEGKLSCANSYQASILHHTC